LIDDRELAGLFKKTQLLNNRQKETVKDLLSAFILKEDLKERFGEVRKINTIK